MLACNEKGSTFGMDSNMYKHIKGEHSIAAVSCVVFGRINIELNIILVNNT
ncbi:hypothetical protein N4T77_03380 [Clostridium sp. CX1]|uniref:hypothetical protein n=1 Tax=Clostridium sp. CX1 TaxID=2978346 RepID=UPI0021BE5A86|nr:hypothetical protein [Clostridium sp. CX1]MCT8975636.1 hypothetical protein [Clostridium sp. CX1]